MRLAYWTSGFRGFFREPLQSLVPSRLWGLRESLSPWGFWNFSINIFELFISPNSAFAKYELFCFLRDIHTFTHGKSYPSGQSVPEQGAVPPSSLHRIFPAPLHGGAMRWVPRMELLELHSLLAVWPRANDLISINLSFPICDTGLIMNLPENMSWLKKKKKT